MEEAAAGRGRDILSGRYGKGLYSKGWKYIVKNDLLALLSQHVLVIHDSCIYIVTEHTSFQGHTGGGRIVFYVLTQTSVEMSSWTL